MKENNVYHYGEYLQTQLLHMSFEFLLYDFKKDWIPWRNCILVDKASHNSYVAFLVHVST
jgi:hypothetical protein